MLGGPDISKFRFGFLRNGIAMSHHAPQLQRDGSATVCQNSTPQFPVPLQISGKFARWPAAHPARPGLEQCRAPQACTRGPPREMHRTSATHRACTRSRGSWFGLAPAQAARLVLGSPARTRGAAHKSSRAAVGFPVLPQPPVDPAQHGFWYRNLKFLSHCFHSIV